MLSSSVFFSASSWCLPLEASLRSESSFLLIRLCSAISLLRLSSEDVMLLYTEGIPRDARDAASADWTISDVSVNRFVVRRTRQLITSRLLKKA